MKKNKVEEINAPVEIHELEYERATNPRRIASNLLDTFLSLLLGMILLCLTFYLIEVSPVVGNFESTRNEIALSSGLYEKSEIDGFIIRKNENILDSEELTSQEKIDKLHGILYTFYQNEDFFNTSKEGLDLFYDYFDLGIDENENKLFDENHNRIYLSSDYDQAYLNFYNDLFNLSTGYLANNSDYLHSSQAIILILIFSIIGTMLVPFIIFYYIIPLFFVRTRQTLGMLLTKTAIINYDGLAVSFKKHTFRFIFIFIFEIICSIFAFLVPFIVSFSMMILSKSHQTLHDYLFSTYCVNITDRTIYKDKYEYKLSLRDKEGLRIEDKDYKPYIEE